MSNQAVSTLRLDTMRNHVIDADIICVLTRFGLRNLLYLFPTWRDYRRTLKQARTVPGFLRAAFLIENLTTCYSLSLWENWAAIPKFGSTAPFHVDAARRVFGRLSFTQEQGVELWSTKWRLVTVSNNLTWDGFDLRALILATQQRTGDKAEDGTST